MAAARYGAQAGRLAVEILVRPWAQHSVAARSTLASLVLGGALLKMALGVLRKRGGSAQPKSGSRAAGSGSKQGPIRRAAYTSDTK